MFVCQTVNWAGRSGPLCQHRNIANNVLRTQMIHLTLSYLKQTRINLQAVSQLVTMETHQKQICSKKPPITSSHLMLLCLQPSLLQQITVRVGFVILKRLLKSEGKSLNRHNPTPDIHL